MVSNTTQHTPTPSQPHSVFINVVIDQYYKKHTKELLFAGWRSDVSESCKLVRGAGTAGRLHGGHGGLLDGRLRLRHDAHGTEGRRRQTRRKRKSSPHIFFFVLCIISRVASREPFFRNWFYKILKFQIESSPRCVKGLSFQTITPVKGRKKYCLNHMYTFTVF